MNVIEIINQLLAVLMHYFLLGIGYLIAPLIIIGSLFSLISSFGLIRLPDVYTRSHAATKSATLGIICILTAAFIYFAVEQSLISARLILGIVFVFITAPVAGHLICRAAYRTQVKLWEKSVQDELKPVLKKEDLRQSNEG